MDVFIYALLDQRTDAVRYVGMTRALARRINQYRHKGHTPHLTNWLRSVGTALVCQVLDVVSHAVADERERVWIRHFRDQGCSLINYTSGGEGGFTISDSHKEKLRQLRRAELANGTHSFQDPDVRARQREAARRNGRLPKPWAGKRLAALNVARRGIPLSAAHKEAVRQASLGRKHTVVARERMCVAQKRLKLDPDYLARLSVSLRNSPKVAASLRKAQEASLVKRRGVALTLEHRRKVSEAMKGRRNAGLVAYWEARKSDGRQTVTESSK